MLSIREYTDKIKSFKNTLKITKTMKMVSASKLRRANQAQANAKAYVLGLQALLLRLVAQVKHSTNPLLQQQASTKPNKSILMLVFTSDRGLCGGYNNNLIKYIEHWINENLEPDQTIKFSFCGKKGYQALSKHYDVDYYYEGVTVSPKKEDTKSIFMQLQEAYINQKYDRVYIAYNLFQSAISQIPTIEQFLPLDPSKLTGEDVSSIDTIYEPSQEKMLDLLLPQFLQFQIFYILLENAAGEHGARMTAMDNATRNTSDLIDEFTLRRNRARQAAITTELIEIISGAEALHN